MAKEAASVVKNQGLSTSTVESENRYGEALLLLWLFFFFSFFSPQHVLFLSSKSYMKSNGSRTVGLIKITGNQVNINVN